MERTIIDYILDDRDVPQALSMLGKRMAELGINEGADELDGIRADYRLMCSCMRRGIRDPKGDAVYMELLRRLYDLYCEVRLASIVRNRSSYAQCKTAASRYSMQQDYVRSMLENFVQDVAVASLLPTADEQRRAISEAYDRHQRYMDSLFCHLVVSKPWSDGTARFYENLLLSPTIDSRDAMLIVSAITMSLLTVFDSRKWMILVYLYTDSMTEAVRQRALTGIFLTLPDSRMVRLFPEIADALQHLCSKTDFSREITELQIQILHCVRTEADNATIQRDIMPTLVENNRFKVTPFGLEEKDDDSIDDIADGARVDRNMEKLEASMNRMMEMQKAGSDIYFGGFSQMKRFSFFYQLSNWFAPFYVEHPGVARIFDDESMDFLHGVVDKGPFCDSDKYSFVLAFASVAKKLPDSVKEVVRGGGAIHGADNADRSSAAWLRRMYLQNLYRFFRLYNGRRDFANPFGENADGDPKAFFVNNPLVAGYMSENLVDVELFLYRNKMYGLLLNVATRRTRSGMATVEERRLCALANMHLGKTLEAQALFNMLVKADKTDRVALKGMAKTCFLLGEFEESAEYYDRLSLMYNGEEKRRFMVYCSLSLINSGHVKEGMSDLFRLDYEKAGDYSVRSVMAWGYLVDCKPAEAERIYDALAGDGTLTSADRLNYGYAKWLVSKVDEAVDLFAEYDAECLAPKGRTIANAFKDDYETLRDNGVRDFEIRIMCGMVAENGGRK